MNTGALLALCCLGSCLPLPASDWPQWRGPTGMGSSDEKGLPTSWGGAANDHVRWSSPLPASDPSQSSPIVWGDRVFVTTALNAPVEHHVVCYDAATGQRRWDTLVPPGPWLLSDLRGGYACATPATDGTLVFALFGSAVLAALDADGHIVWHRDIEPRPFDVAIASSPIIYKDMVILLCDQTTQHSFIIAFDAKTGDVKWKSPQLTSGIIGVPSTWKIGGKQYVGIWAGWGGVWPLWAGPLAKPEMNIPRGGQLYVFALGS